VTLTLNILAPSEAERKLRNNMPVTTWHDIEIVINGGSDEYDAIVVLQSTRPFAPSQRRCRVGNAILIVREPEHVLRMPTAYVKQFDRVISPNRKVRGSQVTYQSFGQLWSFDMDHAAVRKATLCPDPRDAVSAVISDKVMTRQHANRLAYVRALKATLGARFDWYGRGVRDIGDKWDATYPYRYQLVIENGQWPDYWTEKLTDAYMGFSLPFYVGCPNIKDYFSSASLCLLDPDDPTKAAATIVDAMENERYIQGLPHLLESRDRILNRYGFFPTLVSLLEDHEEWPSRQWRTLELDTFRNSVKDLDPKAILKRLRARLLRGRRADKA
jgi:hypothetical protein